MMKRYDMIVVGAGPAGLSAAIEAAKKGMHVVVYDENAKPGGQLFQSKFSFATFFASSMWKLNAMQSLVKWLIIKHSPRASCAYGECKDRKKSAICKLSTFFTQKINAYGRAAEPKVRPGRDRSGSPAPRRRR